MNSDVVPLILRKIAFLDRDGVINQNPPPHQYVTKVEDFTFNPNTISLLKRLNKDGFDIIVVTNQRGIARGLMSEETLAEIHEHMKRVLKRHGINILDIFYCSHENDACDCRKPKDGLLKMAANKYNVDRLSSIYITDSKPEIDMAKNFGIGKSILVRSNHPEEALAELPKRKIRIAFVKFGGLSSGGTEKFMQIIAANLPKDRFEVDYYYSDAAPLYHSDFKHPDTDPDRVAYVKEHGVRPIKFHVGAKDLSTYDYHWIDTDFWKIFDEQKYDIIQTGKAGRIEYPFNKIRHTPIVDSIHLRGGVDNQYNISRVLHITDMMARQWTKDGGDPSRVVRISLPVDIPRRDYGNYKEDLGIGDKFVFGMHQRPDNGIFSPIPLAAYKEVMGDNTFFLMLGGGELYRAQAKELGLKNIAFLPATGDKEKIFKFISTLDVYTHGRRDGENNSQAIAEAMNFGLPIVSHYSDMSNGHVETISTAGKVVHTIPEYAAEMKKLLTDTAYHAYRSKEAFQNFERNYDLSGQMKRIIETYEDVLRDPFPFPLRRFLYQFHYVQIIRPALANIYYFFKFKKYRSMFKSRQPIL